MIHENILSQLKDPFSELESGIRAALETYSNVHRGSGHNSLVSTYLIEKAREIVLDYLELDSNRYVVIFCSPRRAEILGNQLKPGSYKIASSSDIGLPIGVKALAVKKNKLPSGAPFQTGGGTTTLVAPGYVIWAKAPDRFEAGTPAIINVIAFARALKLIKKTGKNVFTGISEQKLTVSDILYDDELKEYSGKELLARLKQTLLGSNIIVPTLHGSVPFINLDYSASTPTFESVWKTVCQTWRQNKDVHQEIIREVRTICSGFLGASLNEYDVIFTSNATESINLAAENLKLESDPDIEPVVLNTIMEHTSNELPWRMIKNISLVRMQVDNMGIVDVNEIDKILCSYNKDSLYGKKRIRIVAMSGASNVLGVFNKLEEISGVVHKYGAQLMVDAAQMVAHRKIEMGKSGIDYLAFSAHKIYAPFGTGVLVARKGLLNFTSSEMEKINSSGEENVVGISSLGKVLLLLQRAGMDYIHDEEQALTARALRGLSKIPEITIYGIQDPDSSQFSQKGGVIVFSLKEVFSNKIAGELAYSYGIGVRYGCHCAHILIKHLLGVGPSLQRFQRVIASLFPGMRFPGLTRISFGIGTDEKEIDALVNAVEKISRKKSQVLNKDYKDQMNNFTRAAENKVYS